MTYLIGAILVLLLIGLILVFRPPKRKTDRVGAQQKSAPDGNRTIEDLIDQKEKTAAEKVSDGEEELNLDFTAAQQAAESEDSIEELDLVLIEEVDDDREEDRWKNGPAPTEAEKKGVDEFDEDIPFIVPEEEGGEAREEGDFSPALADVPEDYAQFDESETPEELAERLEYFLGSGDEEAESQELDDKKEADVPSAAEPEAREEPEEEREEVFDKEELTRDEYIDLLNKREEKLRQKMNAAIQEREAVKYRLFEAGLEKTLADLADMDKAFEWYHSLLKETDNSLTELEQELPGFELRTARNRLYQGDHEDLGNMIEEAACQLQSPSSLAARILYLGGRLAEEQGDFSRATAVYARAAGFDEEHLAALDAAGRTARLIGDHEQALTFLEKRVNIGQERNEESLELARSQHELARTLLVDDQTEKAEPLLQQAGDTFGKLAADDNGARGAVLHDQAVLFESTGRYEQAEPLYIEAIALLEQGPDKDNLRLATTLNRLGGLYEETEQEDKSEPLYFRALEIKKKVLGENHPDVGAILGHLANLLKRKGNLEEAEPMFRKSMEIAEISLGKDHPNLAMIYTDMAELYSEMGNEEQAQIFQERAFAQFGLPGMGDGFVEMSRDDDYDADDDKDQEVTGN